jgi:hypothetical protein
MRIMTSSMEQFPPKQTPRKKSRRQYDADGEFVMEEESPTKKARTPATSSPTKKAKAPATPSKAVQRKAEAAQRRQWKSNWETWVVDSQWKDNPKNPYQQKENTFEIHKSDGD